MTTDDATIYVHVGRLRYAWCYLRAAGIFLWRGLSCLIGGVK